MELVPNAKKVALYSLSLWINRLAFALMILPELLFAWSGIDINPALMFWVGVALYIGVEIARLINQGIGNKKVRSPVIIMVLAMGSILYGDLGPAKAQNRVVTQEQFLAVAIPHVAKWEGKTNFAFLDRIASPPVWTVCHGETRGVKKGDYYTDSQCAAMLGKAILVFRKDLHKAFTSDTKEHRLTPKRDAAYVSLAYNAGVYAISRSTAVRRLNAGDIAGGCQAISWWDKAGNKRIRGLANRRKEDVAYCMAGLA